MDSGVRARDIRLIVAVAGTDTEVGKTWVACEVAVALRRLGVETFARKPVQSFEAELTDSMRLAAATGELPSSICPSRWSFAVPMAPPMAADVLGEPRLVAKDLIDWLVVSTSTFPANVTLVELVGGVCSPQTHDADGLVFLRLLNPDAVLLVSPSGLGALNSIRLSMKALRNIDCLPDLRPTVILNQFDPQEDLHTRNFAWLRDYDGYDVTTCSPDNILGLAKNLAQLMHQVNR